MRASNPHLNFPLPSRDRGVRVAVGLEVFGGRDKEGAVRGISQGCHLDLMLQPSLPQKKKMGGIYLNINRNLCPRVKGRKGGDEALTWYQIQ